MIILKKCFYYYDNLQSIFCKTLFLHNTRNYSDNQMLLYVLHFYQLIYIGLLSF